MSYLDALFSLNGKVALVTGSNRGIGYSLARGLALAGASVVLYGPFFVAQAAARGMAARAPGSIINICSVAQSGLRGPSIVPYTASKGRLK